jgi:hypothetical protein
MLYYGARPMGGRFKPKNLFKQKYRLNLQFPIITTTYKSRNSPQQPIPQLCG